MDIDSAIETLSDNSVLDLRILSDVLSQLQVPEVVALLGRVSPRRRALLFRLLSKDRAPAVFEVLDAGFASTILADAEAEDAARTGGAEPLRRPYLAARLLDLVRARAVWLLVLVGASTLTVAVQDMFAPTLEKSLALAPPC